MPLSPALLTGSMIWEEFRGDFSQARTAAEAQVLEAQAAGDPHQVACALLTRGVVACLIGATHFAARVLWEGALL